MTNNIFSSLVSITKGIHRESRTEREFQMLLSDVKVNPIASNGIFKIDFKRPLSSKKKYFYRLISNDVETELTSFKDLFPENATEPENKYNCAILFNRFDKYLKDIAKYIINQNIGNDLGVDNDYVITYLKVSAIRLYIELQEQYGHFSDEERYEIQEIAEKYFSDTNFDSSVFVKLEVGKKETAKKSPKPKTKPKTSFGYKNEDTSGLLKVLNDFQLRIDLLDNRTTVQQLYSLLIAKDFTVLNTDIYLQCETTQFSYVVQKLKPFFTGFNPTSIERFGKFITKTGTELKANNLHKNKVHNPKGKEEIDKIIQQLQ